ncbi:MAG: hypothetical protein ACREO5_00620 [Candidatus Binatia bacterium]
MMVRPRLTIINVIGIVLIVLGISMTVLNFLAVRRSITDVESIKIQEITPNAQPNSI